MQKTLTDSYGRRIDYIRLSLTDRCNLRCFYCLPRGFKDFTEPAHWLSFGEIERVIKAFAELGVSRVRLTGGEPLIRRHLPQLVERLAGLAGIVDLSLSTNASLLARHAVTLRQAGISRLNVSLDTLKPERFAAITGGRLAQVVDGLMAAKAAGFHPIKINMLALKDINDDEFEDMVEFCLEHDFTLRLIETMPMGDTGRCSSKHYLNLQAVKKELARKFDLTPTVLPGGGPARYVRVNGTKLCIGFITPISQHFCKTCNRVRLSADGTLFLCLGHAHSYALRPLLRRGISNAALKDAITAAVDRKPERHEFCDKTVHVLRLMSMTGG